MLKANPTTNYNSDFGKAKTELKCRCDALACLLMSQGINLTNVHTEDELKVSKDEVIRVAKEFLQRLNDY
tara:strand:+ start:165 stop:374 length:210 start_codon:yes stop_codon:yes gene_type:complete